MELRQKFRDEGRLHLNIFALPQECLESALRPVLDHHRCKPLYLGANPLHCQLLPDILRAQFADKLEGVLYNLLLRHRAQVDSEIIPGDAKADLIREPLQNLVLQALLHALFDFQVPCCWSDVEKGSRAKEGKPVL